MKLSCTFVIIFTSQCETITLFCDNVHVQTWHSCFFAIIFTLWDDREPCWFLFRFYYFPSKQINAMVIYMYVRVCSLGEDGKITHYHSYICPLPLSVLRSTCKRNAPYSNRANPPELNSTDAVFRLTRLLMLLSHLFSQWFMSLQIGICQCWSTGLWLSQWAYAPNKKRHMT